MELIKNLSVAVFAVIIFLSNFFPIIGPSLVSNGLGFNTKRFKMFYGINTNRIMLTILIGNITFFLFAGMVMNYVVEFSSQKYLWLIIISGFIINQVFSIIFYFIGINRYKNRVG